jgi:cytochrome c553
MKEKRNTGGEMSTKRWIGFLAAALWAGVFLVGAWAADKSVPAQVDLDEEWRIQFQVLALQLAAEKMPHQDRPYNAHALVQASDRNPVGLMLRRTRAMLEDLSSKPGFKLDAAECFKRLEALEKQAAALPPIGKNAVPAIDIKYDNKDIDGPPLPKAGDGVDMGVYKDAFVAACQLNREIALANPLMDIDKLVFVLKYPPRNGHMCDQWFGMVQCVGGGLYVLENPAKPDAKLTNLTAGLKVSNGRLAGQELHEGVFASPELAYDGKSIWFAYSELKVGFDERWEKAYRADLADPSKTKKTAPWGGGDLWSETNYIRKIDDSFHLMRIDADGSNLVQMTDGAEDDHSPCVLPNGRVAFVSTRRQCEGRCHPRPCPAYTLFSMLPDGSDIQPLSYHEINEWTPRVNNDGDVIYARWDYVDRNFSDGQQMWIIKPDGRGSRALFGNYESPFQGNVMEDFRAIAGTSLYVGVMHAHHCSAYGSLMVFDHTKPDDPQQSCVTSLTPDIAMYPSRYASPYPLDKTYFLVAWSPDSPSLSLNTWRWDQPPTPHGIYLLDAFGNRVLIYRDKKIPAMAPQLLRARAKEPIQPHMVANAYPPGVEPNPKADPTKAYFACMNVYDSKLPWPEDRKIKSLRIVQIFPKTSPRKGNPPISYNVEVNSRGVIGTVPVEADGSAYFEMPVGKPVYFQALDENGLAIQSMRSSAYAMPGETHTCLGCHENKTQAPPAMTRTPLALQRPPSIPTPGPEGSYPISFPRLVQPVLDAKCVGCHEKEKAKGAPDLSSKRQKYTTAAYENLGPYAWCLMGNGVYTRRPKELAKKTSPVRSIPGEVGATESRLYPLLTTGSHKDLVKLTDEEMARVTTWLDCLSVFFSAYHDTEKQKDGALVMPLVE